VTGADPPPAVAAVQACAGHRWRSGAFAWPLLRAAGQPAGHR
jgi:hypothetical protein